MVHTEPGKPGKPGKIMEKKSLWKTPGNIMEKWPHSGKMKFCPQNSPELPK